MRPRGRQGFTLIEMMVVVLVVGALATLSYWSYAGVAPKWRLDTAGRDVSSQLTLARAEAISKNRQMILHFQTSSVQVARDADRDGVIDAGEVVKVVAYGAGITYYRPAADAETTSLPAGDLVIFDSRGLATNVTPAGMRIGLSNGERTREILVRYVGTLRRYQ